MDAGTTALVITTHHDSHARWLTQGLAAGKAVFEEKPLCLTLEALAAIAAVAGSLSPGPSPTRGGGEQEWQRRGGGDSNPLPPGGGGLGSVGVSPYSGCETGRPSPPFALRSATTQVPRFAPLRATAASRRAPKGAV